MRPNPLHAADDPEIVRSLIAQNPWATIVSSRDGAMIASHYPVLLDDADAALAVVTHVGRPDDELHGFGDSEMLLIVAGAHGYISPSWYAPQAAPVPTWNFSVAHCYGVPEILAAEQNLRTLERLVAHFERHVPEPVWLGPDAAARLGPGTVGIRLPITRFVCKVKHSQDKDPQSQRQVIEALRRPGPYANDALADDMDRTLGTSAPGAATT